MSGRVVEHELVAWLEAGGPPDRAPDGGLRPPRAARAPRPQAAHHLHYAQVAIAEHGVDREAHEEHVDRARAWEEQPLVGGEGRPTLQSDESLPCIRRDRTTLAHDASLRRA